MSSQEPPNKKPKQVENKQGPLLSWVKPCPSDTEPGVVEERIRIKEQPRNENDLEPSTTIAGKYALTVGPKQEGGVNVGHSLSPPSHFNLATGLHNKSLWYSKKY